jgi:hypothetical protein
MNPLSQRLGSSACLLAILAGCNSVLGIEEATLDPGSATPRADKGKPQIKPTLSCDEPTSDCKLCRESCDLESCLGDNDCRDGLFNYRSCLGGDCTDDEFPACLETFAGSASNSSTFPNCVLGNCAEACEGKPLVSTCELYCACLSQNCEEDHASLQNCLQQCKDANNPALYGCRLVHCQYVPKYGQAHCAHAMGDGMCEEMPLKAPAFDCEDRRISGWTCERNDECCSESCVNNFCD